MEELRVFTWTLYFFLEHLVLVFWTPRIFQDVTGINVDQMVKDFVVLVEQPTANRLRASLWPVFYSNRNIRYSLASVIAELSIECLLDPIKKDASMNDGIINIREHLSKFTSNVFLAAAFGVRLERNSNVLLLANLNAFIGVNFFHPRMAFAFLFPTISRWFDVSILEPSMIKMLKGFINRIVTERSSFDGFLKPLFEALVDESTDVLNQDACYYRSGKLMEYRISNKK